MRSISDSTIDVINRNKHIAVFNECTYIKIVCVLNNYLINVNRQVEICYNNIISFGVYEYINAGWA